MGKDMGLRIAQILQNRRMTQKELAARIGATEAAVSRYISGGREPKPEILANIAAALHTTSDFLLGIETEGYSRQRIIKAKGKAEELFGERAGIYGFEPLGDIETIEFIKMLIEHVAYRRILAAGILIAGGIRVNICMDSKGQIRVTGGKSMEYELEEQKSPFREV